MSRSLTGIELLEFLKRNTEMTRKDQALEAGYGTLLDFVNAIAQANKLNPDFWNNNDGFL
ncbi:hypothetical protein [Prochlorococcus sp. MIT 1341]|uniref:hypothetical protein n=1 Tax=Prochlorococcus sp. MIT 1341 TaxID=3096221 RepID=UPI002A75172D|nr:hypothetical protein [Prochlorococcus sp. MIT 1341]